MSNTSKKFVNDIVHGMIDLPDYIVEIIDTTFFQRLKFISQLSFANYVYPSATHSRFEHSIGTFHLASTLIRQLQKQANHEKLVIKINRRNEDLVTENDVKCVEIAALCHDLGHGPYSHLWESAIEQFSKNRSHRKKHEDLSCEILQDLMDSKKSGQNRSIKEKLCLNEELIDRICRIILGTYDESKDNGKHFLFEIVANKGSGLDVDKFDYLCRDTIYLGWSNIEKIRDVKRILYFTRVVKFKDSTDVNSTVKWHLAMRYSEIFHIYDVFYSRHLLHRYGCHHKTKETIEHLFISAVKIIVNDDDYFDQLMNFVNIAVHDENRKQIEKLRKQIEEGLLTKASEDYQNTKYQILCSKEFISRVCDYHIWNMMQRFTPWIIEEIHERKLHKLICKLQVKRNISPNMSPNISPNISRENLEGIVKTLEEKLPEALELTNSNGSGLIQVIYSSFSLSSEGGDPIFEILFYEKENKYEAKKFNEINQPSVFANLIKNEHIIMIFIDPGLNSVELLRRFEEIKKFLCGTECESLEACFNNIHRQYSFLESKY